MGEIDTIRAANQRAIEYLNTVDARRVFPDQAALEGLDGFDEALPDSSSDPMETLALLNDLGTPATVTNNGGRYFGFVIGATLPAAAAAERLASAWDQCGSSFVNSPVAARIETVATNWVLDILDLPRESQIGFGTSATACGLSMLAVARRTLLKRKGWDIDADGLVGAPEVKLMVSETIHITIKKAAKLLGFGLNRLLIVPCDEDGRVIVNQMPKIDDMTIVCLQAGEVNKGSFDRFSEIIPVVHAAGAWVHVDGAFGLWARASEAKKHLTHGVELADSWTTDGHKWLNTPYDGAMAICRHADEFAATLNSDAVYSTTEPFSQKNLVLEFSRRARGIPIWAALRSLGRQGVDEMVTRHCAQAVRLAEGLRGHGVTVLNDVVINQVLCTLGNEQKNAALIQRISEAGEIWFGPSKWRGESVFRLSVSSWRTTDEDIERAIDAIGRAIAEL
ncbi:pyridoxal-dependent decarboxylase [uncultured Maritalea sp.]|uniref:pyridoxal phosphate-dependent decarboxylase family protein n=1 Tax=uncultured Maritalea sp. TaxID=757249 RepID=UPI00261F3FD7|nr:pyridoxal-dependent decarboxylase [uncultured Maritalea sp.]